MCKNNNRLISDEKYYKQFLCKITLNGSETIVTRKFPLQEVREQTPPNQDQKPRTRGNNSAFSPANNPGSSNKTPSGGGDMEVYKVMLICYVVTSNVCLRHSSTFDYGDFY